MFMSRVGHQRIGADRTASTQHVEQLELGVAEMRSGVPPIPDWSRLGQLGPSAIALGSWIGVDLLETSHRLAPKLLEPIGQVPRQIFVPNQK